MRRQAQTLKNKKKRVHCFHHTGVEALMATISVLCMLCNCRMTASMVVFCVCKCFFNPQRFVFVESETIHPINSIRLTNKNNFFKITHIPNCCRKWVEKSFDVGFVLLIYMLGQTLIGMELFAYKLRFDTVDGEEIPVRFPPPP